MKFSKKVSRIIYQNTKYGNAVTEDLWKSLEKVSGQKCEKIMKVGQEKPGYRLSQCWESNNKLNWTQSRFFSSPLSAKRSSDKTLFVNSP